MSVRVWLPRDFVEHSSREYWLLGLLLGVFLAVILANVWHGLWRREAIYRRYILYLLATVGLLLGINGLTAEFLFPEHPYWAHYWVSVSNLLVYIFGAYFYMQALDIQTAAPWVRWVYRSMFWLSILCLPTPFLNLYPEAVQILLPLALLLLFSGAWRSVQLWQQRNANGKILLLAHLFGLAGASSTVLTLLGVLPGHFFLIYSFQLGAVGTLLALQWMLGQHVRTVEAQQIQAGMDIKLANAAAQQERLERERQRHFLSMLTHELKTPLSVIRMRLGADKPTTRMADHAKQAVKDIDAIVERCAMVSQMEEGTYHPEFSSCELNEMLIEVLAQQHDASRVVVQLSNEVRAVAIHTDCLLLRAILSNLIDNALKYSSSQDRVKVTAALGIENDRKGTCIQIENPTGSAGLPDPARIFDKFYRAPKAHQQSGSGLGLYIVKAFVEQLGGIIFYRPQTDRVVFQLWLPH